MRIAYADPPYPGMAHLYADQPDYGGEVDHVDLCCRLVEEFDGWVLHTAATTLDVVLDAVREAGAEFYRVCAWLKPFAAFRPNVPVAYAWEPVIIAPARSGYDQPPAGVVMRDWIEEPAVREVITMRRGFIGAKPERVCRWAFEVVGLEPGDDFVDMFPGSGAVTRAHEAWRAGRAGILDGPGQLWEDVAGGG